MRMNIEIMGGKLLIETSGLNHIYVETTRYEFFYGRDWWFAAPSGKDRHWCIDRKKSVAATATSATLDFPTLMDKAKSE